MQKRKRNKQRKLEWRWWGESGKGSCFRPSKPQHCNKIFRMQRCTDRRKKGQMIRLEDDLGLFLNTRRQTNLCIRKTIILRSDESRIDEAGLRFCRDKWKFTRFGIWTTGDNWMRDLRVLNMYSFLTCQKSLRLSDLRDSVVQKLLLSALIFGNFETCV